MSNPQPQPPLQLIPSGAGGASILPPPEVVLATSRPRPRLPVQHLVLIAMASTIAGLFFGDTPGTGAVAWARRLVPMIVPFGVLAFALLWGAHLSAELREEERSVAGAEDALRLKRRELAAHLIHTLTSRPMQSPLSRLRLLCAYVGALLGERRFEDAATAATGLLEEGVPAEMVPPLRMARAFALLREDRLVDADRAIHDLRRTARDLEREGSAGTPGAMLTLLEIYRDVRSGHPDEALATHARSRQQVADHLGIRVADADALAALAAHHRARPDDARRFWLRATLMQNPAELIERYPELAPLTAYPTASQVEPSVLSAITSTRKGDA